MEFHFRFLSEGDIERIHENSLRVLNEIGMSLRDDEICRFLKKQGISVEGNLVRFPPEAVEEALKVAPRDFSLYSHDGQELPLKPGYVHPSTYTNALNVWDYGARSLRPSTKEDLEKFVLLGDALPEVHIVAPACWARDMPEATQGLHSAATVLANATKHTNAAPQNRAEAKIWADLVSIADGELEPKVWPTIHFAVSPTSPLQLDSDTAQTLRYGAERDIPLVVASCPMAGATSPYTITGTLIQANAENLFLLTLAQLIHEGAPVIVGGAAGAVDLRTGGLSYGCPERHIMLGANIELARYYGLPHHSPAGSVDAIQPDIQSGAEKMLTWVSRLLEDINLGIAFGSLSTGSAVSLEQMVIDADTLESARRLFRGAQVNEETIGFEAMKRVGPGGNYLMDEHTLRWMRSQEYYQSSLVNREGTQGLSMLERAHAWVEEILRQHRPQVSERVKGEIQAYVQEKARSLG